MTPRDCRPDVHLPARGEKPEEVRIVGSRALPLRRPAEIVPAADLLDRPKLQVVLMQVVDDRDLEVVTGWSVKVRQRVKAQERQRLRADAALRNAVAGNRNAGSRIN